MLLISISHLHKPLILQSALFFRPLFPLLFAAVSVSFYTPHHFSSAFTVIASNSAARFMIVHILSSWQLWLGDKTKAGCFYNYSYRLVASAHRRLAGAACHLSRLTSAHARTHTQVLALLCMITSMYLRYPRCSFCVFKCSIVCIVC